MAKRGWGGETRGFDLDVEEGGEAGNGGYSVKVEVFPGADIADVPPEVFGSAITVAATAFSDWEDGGVGLGEVGGQGTCGVEIVAGPEGEFRRQSSR